MRKKKIRVISFKKKEEERNQQRKNNEERNKNLKKSVCVSARGRSKSKSYGNDINFRVWNKYERIIFKDHSRNRAKCVFSVEIMTETYIHHALNQRRSQQTS